MMNLEPRRGLKNPTPGAKKGTRLARKHAKIAGHAAETRLGNDHEAGRNKQSLHLTQGSAGDQTKSA